MSAQIGDYILDQSRGMLLDSSGDPVPVRPQSFRVLSVLADRMGEIVSKDELSESVWNGIAVTDDSLVQCIGDLRRALGDSGHDVLQTVPKRGYTLVGSDIAENAAPQPVVRPRLAVLPLETSGADMARWLASGLAADLVTDLARHRDVSIVATNSVHAFLESGEPLSSIGSALGVRYLLSGRLHATEDWVKLSVELSDAATGDHVWSDRFEKLTRDVFDLEDMLTAAIVNRLVGTAGVIFTADREVARRKAPSSLEAYDSYVIGLNLNEAFSPHGSEEAAKYFTQAVKIDPSFARAWQRLASIHLMRASFGYADDVAAECATFIDAAERAAALDAEDPAAQATLAVARFMQGETKQGERAFRRAIELGPNDADALAFIAYTRPTKLPTAAEDLVLVRRAMRLNPYHPEWYTLAAGYAAFYAGEPSRAIEELELTRAEIADRHLYLALSYAALGEMDKAATYRHRFLEIVPDFTIAGAIAADSIIDEAAAKRFANCARLAALPEGG